MILHNLIQTVNLRIRHQERHKIAHLSTLPEQGISVRAPITLLSRLRCHQAIRLPVGCLQGRLGGLNRVMPVLMASCHRLGKYGC